MVDIEGILLYKLLEDPEAGLEEFSRLRTIYFSKHYQSIFNQISSYYDKYSKLPTQDDITVIVRNQEELEKFYALKQIEVSDTLDINLVTDALLNYYTQNEALKSLNDFVDNITMLDCDEIKSELSNIILQLEDKVHTDNEVFLATDLSIFSSEELEGRIPLGLNNTFDAHTGGCAPSELIMIGGYRGDGKSVISSNICINEYLAGNIGLYFSIEMAATQVFRRNIAILAEVSASRIKKHTSTSEELARIAKVRADMFVDANEIYSNYLRGKFQTYDNYEQELIKEYKLKEHNQLIIVKNRTLTLAEVDLHLTKLKERHGEHLKVCVVDYINQLSVEDMYDWKVQVELSKSLKNLAEKHEVLMVTPYQIDIKKEARFSKGILDAADIALTIKKGDDYIEFSTTKIRDDAGIKFASITDWDTLKIYPDDKIFEAEQTDEPDDNARKAGDLPF